MLEKRVCVYENKMQHTDEEAAVRDENCVRVWKGSIQVADISGGKEVGNFGGVCSEKGAISGLQALRRTALVKEQQILAHRPETNGQAGQWQAGSNLRVRGVGKPVHARSRLHHSAPLSCPCRMPSLPLSRTLKLLESRHSDLPGAFWLREQVTRTGDVYKSSLQQFFPPPFLATYRPMLNLL